MQLCWREHWRWLAGRRPPAIAFRALLTGFFFASCVGDERRAGIAFEILTNLAGAPCLHFLCFLCAQRLGTIIKVAWNRQKRNQQGAGLRLVPAHGDP